MPEAAAPIVNGQGTPDGAQASGAPPAGAPPAAPPTPAGSAIPWLEGADEVTVGYVQNKGWKEPAQVLDGYRNLEKLLGADRAGNTVVLPKPDAPPEEVAKFYDRLGRPGEPAGYKLQVPEGAPPEFAQAAAAKLHELGLSQKQGEALGTWWNEQAAASMKAAQDAKAAQFATEDQALKTEWGAAFQQNLTAAQAAARGLGLDAATIDKMADAMGHKAVMGLLHKIGSKMGEAEFVSGERKEPFGAALTPGQAKAEIQGLTADKAFVARYMSKDAGAVEEMKRLHAFAYPDEAEK